MTQAEIYTAVPEHLPKNFPFYNWVPKPLGIAFLVILFIPIMTVSGAYTVNSSEMVGGLGIQSEHIAFISFVTSIGMAAFSPFFYSLVSVRRQKMMSLVGFSILAVQSYICAIHLGSQQPHHGIRKTNATDVQPIYAHQIRIRH